MALFNKTKGSKNRAYSGSSAKIDKNNYKKFVVKAISLIKGAEGRENLTAPEYNLAEIREASEADSYIKIALMKYSYMLFKAGYLLKSDNELASSYIKKRFYIMSFSTGKPIDILFQEIGNDIIKYSNAFLVKSRVAQIMPGVQAKGFYKDKPVGGYFRIDPSSISIERDKYGTILKYVQSIDGEEKKFEASEVIHFYLDREAANAFGTPRIIAALEDVKLLRRIEGNVISMVYRFAMPLFQWIVGLPQTGFQATDKEIDQVRKEIENMALDGSVVTNEKTTVKVIGAEGTALNAEGYMKYFEQRVFSALGVSDSQMGRGGAKQDADSMESQAHDTVKHIQKTFSLFAENFIINELLLEGGFNPVINEDDRVNFVFNEINISAKIKVENHELAKFQSNMITFEEMRNEIGKKEEVDESRLYKTMIEVDAEEKITKIRSDESVRLAEVTNDLSIEAAHAASQDQAKIAKETATIQAKAKPTTSTSSGSKGVNPKGNGTTKSQKPNKDISNKNTPVNQHGKTSVKVKESLDIKEKAKNDKATHVKTFSKIYNRYNKLSNDIKVSPQDIDLLIPLAYESMLSEIRLEMQRYAYDAMEQARKDISKTEGKELRSPSVSISLMQFEDLIERDLKKVLKDIKKRIGNNTNPAHISVVFETFEYRVRYMLEYVLPKVFWFSYLKSGESFGYNKAYIDFDGSDDEDNHSKYIYLNALNVDEIPPYHPFCDCKVVFKKGDE